MAKTFRPWDFDQVWLLPPSVQDFVPPGHTAHFVRDLVREGLDLSSIMDEYAEERGFPPYHPAMMTALLLYAYSQGVYSSRRIARGCEERVDFMAVTGMQRPDFRTISDFRKRHLEALSGLFVQVLRLCQKAKLVKLGHVSLDGTKIRANASKHKSMSYGRMQPAASRLSAEVEAWLDQAEEVDAAEDESYGSDQRGDELPDWVRHKQKRLAKIQEAKKALESEAKEQRQKALERQPSKDRRPPGRPRKLPSGVPEDRTQRNFTDPDSRIMKTAKGFDQCYNAQAAVDTANQVIVGHHLTQSATDHHQLVPLLDRVQAQAGKLPSEVSADANYCSEDNLEELEQRKIRGYIAVGKQRHGDSAPAAFQPTKPGTRRHAMQLRLRRGGYRSRYRLRKQTSEPVYGQIKQARGFRQFLLRGIAKVPHEWGLICTAHNVLKLAAASA